MNYTLVGAPDTGKREVAERLQDIVEDGALIVYEKPRDDLGFLADYRSEIHLAATRAINLAGDQNVIFIHSLIDSVGYIGLHVKDLLEEDPNNSNVVRWSSVFNVALQMLIDGKQPDHILYIPYKGEEQNCIDLDDALQDILVTLELDYTEIDPTGEATTWTTS